MLVHENPSDEQFGETVWFVANAFKRAEPVSGILLKRESLTRCKLSRWPRSRQGLHGVSVLQQHSVVPECLALYAAAVVSCEQN